MFCLVLLLYMSSVTCTELLSRQRRTWIIDSFTMEEEYPGPYPYMLGTISVERKYQVYFNLFGEGVDREPKGVLTIDRESGVLYAHKPVDYEKKKTLSLEFEATKSDFSTDTKLGIEISIVDINDNPPRFLRDVYEIRMGEEITQGSILLTVVANDEDKSGTLNSTFHYEIKSVSPKIPSMEFAIDEIGGITFKGCLDYESADMLTLVVEAKDHGEVVSLSSSTTVIFHVQDGNNHLPVFSGQTGNGKVKEREVGVSPLRLHVTDRDSPHSKAWRAKYTIYGDEGQHFKIETDAETNDGVLMLVKPLDFEEGALRELSISVENEMPYFSCKVKKKTSSGLWDVETTNGGDAIEGQQQSVKVSIEVEDINDPPMFTVTVKEAMLEENTPVGTWIEKLTAVDKDSSHSSNFLYTIGDDPAGWMTVDPSTGDITTIKSPDRESPYVVNGVYTITLLAVDSAEPPMTGTATLSIHLLDQNDNIPRLTMYYVDVCVSNEPITTNITAFDPDDNPFGGPFTFELMGDVKGKWKLNPSYGYTTGLVKEAAVFTGLHTIDLKISDMQGQFGIYNLSVTVCECTVTQNCRILRTVATRADPAAVGVVLAALLLLLLLLLMAFVITGKKEFTSMQTRDCSGETLIKSNIEMPGTDCKIPNDVLDTFPDKTHESKPYNHSLYDVKHKTYLLSEHMEQNFTSAHHYHMDNRDENLFSTNWNLVKNGTHVNSWSRLNGMKSSYMSDGALFALLQRRLASFKATEEELVEYKPHIYAEEGDSDQLSDLDNIPITENESFLNSLKDLDDKFKDLAAICQPPDLEI